MNAEPKRIDALLYDSRRLVSLLDMLSQYASIFVRAHDELFHWEDIFRNEVFPESETTRLQQSLREISINAKAVNLSATAHLADHMVIDAIGSEHSQGVMLGKLESLGSLMFAELRERQFFYVPTERAEFYDNRNLCGELVAEKFPAAIPDIIEAGNCYALERPTACVFHLMRIIPYAISEVSVWLEVPYKSDFSLLQWNALIEPIEGAVNKLAKNAPLSVQKRQDQKYYAEIVQHLYFCKDAWRNHVTHSPEVYDMPKAESVLDHTSFVMKLVADRVLDPVTELRK